MSKLFRKSKKGFTLVELIVVIAMRLSFVSVMRSTMRLPMPQKMV